MAYYEPRLAQKPASPAPASPPTLPAASPGIIEPEMLTRMPLKTQLGFLKKAARGLKKAAKGAAKGAKRAVKAAVKAHVVVAKLSVKGLSRLSAAIAKAAATPIRLAAKPIILRRAKYVSYKNRRSLAPTKAEKTEAVLWFLKQLAGKGPLGKLGALILKKTGSGVSGCSRGACVLGAAASDAKMHPYDIALIMALREWHERTHQAKAGTLGAKTTTWWPGGGQHKYGTYHRGGGWHWRGKRGWIHSKMAGYNEPMLLLPLPRGVSASSIVEDYRTAKTAGAVDPIFATRSERGGIVVMEGEGGEMMLGITGAEIASIAASVAAIVVGLAKILNKPGAAPANPVAAVEQEESGETEESE